MSSSRIGGHVRAGLLALSLAFAAVTSAATEPEAAATSTSATALTEASEAAPGETPGDALRAQANSARVAVLARDPSAAAQLASAWTAAIARPPAEPGNLAIRLHLLRSRMLLSPDAPPDEIRALDATLAELELEARARALEGPRAFALLYRAELAATRGEAIRAQALAERVLLVPESDATWEAQVLAEGLRERALRTADASSEGADDEALRGLRRARGILERVRPRVEAELHLARARPIHERLSGRLLAEAEASAAVRPGDEQALLREALDTLEDLKRAELRAYFGDPCLAGLAPTTPERLPGARLLYPVVLEDRVVLIVGRDGALAQVVSPMAPARLQTESRKLRGALQDPTSPRYRTAATALYDALIRPLESAPIALFGETAAGETGGRAAAETLVFVPTGALREIPLAALYDAREERFLIEKTAIATLPSLRIEPPRALDRRRTELLAVGLTGAVEDWPALPFAARELAAISEPFPSSRRLDADFSKSGFAEALDERPFDIVHVASHGRFDAQASESFLLAADGRLTLPELGDLIAKTRHRTRRPLELLVLSACETAIGDERAVLGLAGVAVQSGARSAVASLWKVHDEATMELFATFYRELARPGVGRAEALRRAQRSLLAEKRFRHPIFWSAFLLVNGWL
jgi:CHAT domain-containing protein